LTSVADVYGKKLNRTLNPKTEVIIGHGENGCLTSILQAFVKKGDQIVCFEPFNPIY